MRVKDIVTDVKIWIFIIGAIIIATSTALGWFKLPKRVEKVEAKAVETEDNLEQLAGTVDKYIEVQTVRDESEKEWKQLLMELLAKDK